MMQIFSLKYKIIEFTIFLNDILNLLYMYYNIIIILYSNFIKMSKYKNVLQHYELHMRFFVTIFCILPFNTVEN